MARWLDLFRIPDLIVFEQLYRVWVLQESALLPTSSWQTSSPSKTAVTSWVSLPQSGPLQQPLDPPSVKMFVHLIAVKLTYLKVACLPRNSHGVGYFVSLFI